MEIACLDLEGVLVPEIWIAFAEKTGIESLRATTRDIPDYDVLMKQRLRILDEHGLKLADIQEVIATLKPLDGAIEFVNWLRERFQVVILSDTFYEFSQPLMRQLGFPTLLCHRLITDETDRVVELPTAPERPQAPVGAGVQEPVLPGDCCRRFLQRHHHAGRGRPWDSVPCAGECDPRVPAVPGGAHV